MRDALSWSFPIGQLFGIVIRVHLIMPIFMIGMIGRYAFGKTTSGGEHISGTWIDAAWLMGLTFLSVLLHELGHCFAARRMEGEADEVLLWPLGGLAVCRSLPHTPIAHFVMAAGGPLVNLGLCVGSGVILAFALDQHYLPPFNPFWYPFRLEPTGAMYIPVWGNGAEVAQVIGNLGVPTTNNFAAILLARLFWLNWVLFLINVVLIGIPFDGGRMLQAVLWPRLGHYQATKVAIYAGFIILLVIGILSIVYSEPLLVFLALFIFMSCGQEMMALDNSHEDLLFGYDFSQGYTSLEKGEFMEGPPPPKEKKQNFIKRWLAKRAQRKQQQEDEQRAADDRRMDELLEKIQKFGKGSLTDEEQRFLKRVADRYKNKP